LKRKGQIQKYDQQPEERVPFIEILFPLRSKILIINKYLESLSIRSRMSKNKETINKDNNWFFTKALPWDLSEIKY